MNGRHEGRRARGPDDTWNWETGDDTPLWQPDGAAFDQPEPEPEGRRVRRTEGRPAWPSEELADDVAWPEGRRVRQPEPEGRRVRPPEEPFPPPPPQLDDQTWTWRADSDPARLWRGEDDSWLRHPSDLGSRPPEGGGGWRSEPPVRAPEPSPWPEVPGPALEGTAAWSPESAPRRWPERDVPPWEAEPRPSPSPGWAPEPPPAQPGPEGPAWPRHAAGLPPELARRSAWPPRDAAEILDPDTGRWPASAPQAPAADRWPEGSHALAPDDPYQREGARPRRRGREPEDAATEALRAEVRRARPPERRRVRSDDYDPTHARQTRWLRIFAVIVWILVFMVFCWFYLFPRIERLLPTNF